MGSAFVHEDPDAAVSDRLAPAGDDMARPEVLPRRLYPSPCFSR
jgi:hypothetical protein